MNGFGSLTQPSGLKANWSGLSTLKPARKRAREKESAVHGKSANAKRRASTLGKPTGQALQGGLSLLEREAVAPPSQKDYARRVAQLRTWMLKSGGRLVAEDSVIPWILEYMDHIFFEGETVEEGRKLVAALRHVFPGFAGRGGTVSMHRVERALKGWGRHSFHVARPPLPWIAATAIIGHCIHHGHHNTAMAFMVMFLCYLRPGELASLRGKNLVPPVPHCGLPHWCLVLRLAEDLVPTKIGSFDDSVALNLMSHRWFLPVLRRLKDSKRDDEELWDMDQSQMNDVLHEATLALGMQHMGVALYSFRHGGASKDIITGERDLFTVKKILRHITDLTVRRYEKAGRLAIEVQRMPVATQRYGLRVSNLLAQIFRQPALCPPPPKIPPRFSRDS